MLYVTSGTVSFRSYEGVYNGRVVINGVLMTFGDLEQPKSLLFDI